MSTVCWKRSCSRTMKPVLITLALLTMLCQLFNTCSGFVVPPAMLKSETGWNVSTCMEEVQMNTNLRCRTWPWG